MANDLEESTGLIGQLVEANGEAMLVVEEVKEWLVEFMTVLVTNLGPNNETLEKYNDVLEGSETLIGLIANVGVEAELLQQKLQALQ